MATNYLINEQDIEDICAIAPNDKLTTLNGRYFKLSDYNFFTNGNDNNYIKYDTSLLDGAWSNKAIDPIGYTAPGMPTLCTKGCVPFPTISNGTLSYRRSWSNSSSAYTLYIRYNTTTKYLQYSTDFTTWTNISSGEYQSHIIVVIQGAGGGGGSGWTGDGLYRASGGGGGSGAFLAALIDLSGGSALKFEFSACNNSGGSSGSAGGNGGGIILTCGNATAYTVGAGKGGAAPSSATQPGSGGAGGTITKHNGIIFPHYILKSQNGCKGGDGETAGYDTKGYVVQGNSGNAPQDFTLSYDVFGSYSLTARTGGISPSVSTSGQATGSLTMVLGGGGAASILQSGGPSFTPGGSGGTANGYSGAGGGGGYSSNGWKVNSSTYKSSSGGNGGGGSVFIIY